MLWQMLLVTSVFVSAISTILQKNLLKGIKDPMGFAIFFQLCTALFIGIFAVSQGFAIPDIRPFWLNLLGSIVIYTLANICIFQSLSKIDASEFTILFVTRGAWTILSATVFLHEPFTFMQIIGTLLVLGSVVLVTYRKQLILNTGMLYALGAGVLFGVGYVNDAYIVRFFRAPITYSFLDFVLPGIVLFFLYFKSVKKYASIVLNPQKFATFILLCLLYAIFGIAILLAYKYGGKATVIGAISQTATILTVLLAIVFLRERDNITKKLVGSVIAVVGVILLG
ncbi:MAG: DMT family transporter [Patescibacteria group bacterium]|nr:DMT family transporter [Patescibacteria group bacterium]MDE2590733.1 DMT family transporter [Patescibacteria group bacterium]